MSKPMFFLFFLLFTTSLFSYESENKIQALIIGKIAKFITWEDESRDTFIITMLHNSFGDTLEQVYKGKQIKGKNVEIRYISDIKEIQKTDVLYVSNVTSIELDEILLKLKNTNVLTISDLRGFAEKKGIVQIYFASQKPKLKINLTSAKEQNLQIKSSLLQIADVIKG
ncbi:MAG: YfiR family protein [Sulfurimonas sp.]|uniref:YfiR family protein n=1 Tax=Sulfurimonas sp. TaxID=2022749 RepID=UPI0025E9E6C4|nr:YfiR family protein [Sulfurimonas sp.]MCK9492265.1 YfiR family protein [Sulfurimonas sp.]